MANQLQAAGAQALGASQHLGAPQQLTLAFSSQSRWRWHFGVQLFSQPQTGVQALGAAQTGAQGAGAAQALGASQHLGAAQQATLAFSSASKWRWHFGAQQPSQPQAGAQALGASQQAGAQGAGAAQHFGAQQQAILAFSSHSKWRWHFGAQQPSQPQAGAQALGASQAAGAQAAGAAQHFGAQHLWQQRWQASLAFNRSKRQGRQLFGTQPQAGSQHFGASQAGAQGAGAAQAAGAAQQAGAQQVCWQHRCAFTRDSR
jgi:hypothetical protein